MTYALDNIQYDNTRDNYWTRAVFHSEILGRTSEVLFCTSYDYLSNVLEKENLTNEDLIRWLNAIIGKLEKEESALFEKPVHYEVSAISSDGYANGISFLKGKRTTTQPDQYLTA